MKQFLSVFLSAIFVALCLGCAQQEISQATESAVQPAVYRLTTQADIDAIPIASQDMISDQLRQICVDFFRLQLSYQWVTQEDLSYPIWERTATLSANTVYAGNPYVANALSGNLYSIMEYCDPQTGYLYNPGMEVTDFVRMIGNHCTYGSYWGWARVVNSTAHATISNANLAQPYGYLSIGPYSYDYENFVQWGGSYTTLKVCQDNGLQIMMESYACIQKADAVFTHLDNSRISHMRMAAENATVVRLPDGTIDPENSYLIYLDQVGAFTPTDFGDGNLVQVQGGIDQKVSFAELYRAGYIPFTFGEFLGTDPVEPGQATSPITENATLTLDQLTTATVSANYAISHINYIVTDAQGQELHKSTRCSPRILTMEMSLAPESHTWTTLSRLLRTDDNLTITITCRISNGEVFTVYTGPLVP